MVSAGVALLIPAVSHAGTTEHGALSSERKARSVSTVNAHGSAGLNSRAPRCAGRRASIVVKGRSAKGTSKADVIVVVNSRGARVDSGGGADRICGGPGKDVLNGGPGNDRLTGAGVDQLVGGKGVDEFRTRGRRVRTDLALGELLNGRRKTVEQRIRARRSTVELPAGAAGPVSGGPDGSQTVVLRDGVEIPRIGGALVITASTRQDGLLGLVTSRKSLPGGRVAITTIPTTIDKAYSTFKVKFTGTIAELERTGGAGISSLPAAQASGFLGLLKGAAGKFSCSRNALDTKRPDPIKIDVDFSSAHIDGFADLNIANPAIGFNLVARPTIDVSASFATGGSCRANFPAAHIPVGTTPLMLVIGPYLKADATASVSAKYHLDTRFNLGFVRSKRSSNTDVQVFKVEGTPTITGSGKLTAGLGLSAQMTLGGRVGIGGEIGPQASVEARSTASPAGVSTCVTGTSALHVGLVATADAFVAKWTFTLAQGTFVERTWFNRCVPDEGQGGSPGGGGSGGGGGGGSGGGTGGTWSGADAPGMTALEDVACFAPTDCFAVGQPGTTIQRRNGNTWTPITVPAPASPFTPRLRSLSCTSADACVAVGTVNESSYAVHWNGSTWTLRDLPFPPDAFDAMVRAISCVSATACVAVGHYNVGGVVGGGTPYAARWDGTAWSPINPPMAPSSDANTLIGVYCFAANDCLAVGHRAIFGASGGYIPFATRWNGSGWTGQSLPFPAGHAGAYLTDISCTATNFCMAVGPLNITGVSSDRLYTARWNGATFSTQQLDQPAGADMANLRTVSCTSSTACHAVGSRTGGGITRYFARSWNGTSWVDDSLPEPAGGIAPGGLYGVSCAGSNSCTAVGHRNTNQAVVLSR